MAPIVGHELVVVPCKAEKTMQLAKIPRRLPIKHGCNLALIGCHTFPRNYMSQILELSLAETTFITIGVKLVGLQDC